MFRKVWNVLTAKEKFCLLRSEGKHPPWRARGEEVSFSVLGKPKFLLAIVVIFLAGAVIGATSYHLVERFSPSPQGLYLENVRGKLVNAVAVKPDKTGVLLSLGVTIDPDGKGRILEDTHQLKGFDFQLSHHVAVKVASEVTGAPLDDDGVGIKGVDILFEVFSPIEESVEISAIDGPSAGAAATLAVIAAIENRSLREDAVITGAIREDGTIGPVGGLYVVKDKDGQLHVLGKPAAAHESGMSIFLVPANQPVEYYEPIGLWWMSTDKPVSFLQQCVNQKGWSLDIREVASIEEAAGLMLQ